MQKPNLERRRHVVYITAHSEYHCRDRECVAVRDRRTGQWQRRHQALRSRLVGGTDGKSPIAEAAAVGSRLLFLGAEGVLTSRLLRTDRPPKDVLAVYSSHCVSGAIAG